MSSKALKKEDVKKNLRSLLLSAPAALTIDELKRDYHDFIMEPIPYRALGYVTLEDLLKDMPDALHVTWRKGVMCVAGIADSNTAHIQKLVSKQKVANKNKWATLRKGGPPPQRHKTQHPRPLPTVPPFIRHHLGQLFKSYPDGLPFTHFDAAFSKRFNIQIDPIRLGFSSLKELLQTVPHILEVKELQNGEVRVCPVASSSNNWPQQSKEHPFHKSYQPNLPPRLERQRSSENKNNAQPCLSSTFPSGIAEEMRNVQPKPQINPSQSQGVGRGKKKSCLNRQNDGPKPRRRYESEESSGTFSSDVSVDFESTISHQLLYELQQVLSEKPEGLWATKLLAAYKETFNKELKPLDHGYTSIIELCSALTQVIRMERPHSKGDWKLFDKRLPSPPQLDKAEQNEASGRQRHSSELYADSVFKETVRQVLQAHPEGVRLQDLGRVFQEETGKSLEWEKLGFTRIESFALSMADTVLRFEYKGNNYISLYAIDDGSPPRTNLLKPREATYQPPAIASPPCERVTDSNIPSDAIGVGSYYSQVDLPPCNSWIEVYVSNIASPGQFWFQLRGTKTSLALEKLMNHLEETYCGEFGLKYSIPSEMVTVGLIVAAIFPEDDNWHRCVITGMSPGNYVEVYFVDYGNTCEVHRNNIRLLRSKFFKLPAQAITGRLSNIQPEEDEWSLEANACMLRLVRCRPLVAIATSEKSRVMSLCLSDTSGKEDVHINDILIQEGHAQFVIDNPDLVYTEDPQVITDFPFSCESETGSTFSESTYFENLASLGSSETASRHYVLQLQLTSAVIHLINLEGVAYLLSSEISSFFWDDDVLTSMLFQKKSHINKIKVTVEEYPALFHELYQYGVKSVKQKVLTLYELSGVPDILRLFQCKSEEFKQNVPQLIESFDPEDPYWKGEDFEMTGSEMEQLSTDEINETLQILQFKRKRVLQSMLSSTENTEEVVNELNEVETKIKHLRSLMKSKQDISGRESEASVIGAESRVVDPGQFLDVRKEERRSLPVSPQKIVFGTDLSSKPVATVASMPQPKPAVTESPVLTENPSIPPLNAASILQQITQQQQHLNMFQTLLLNQYTGSATNCPLGPDPLLQVPPNSAPGLNIPGLGRGMPTLNNPLGNFLLPGLVPLLENLNLRQDGPTSQSPGGGHGLPNFQKQNPSTE